MYALSYHILFLLFSLVPLAAFSSLFLNLNCCLRLKLPSSSPEQNNPCWCSKPCQWQTGKGIISLQRR